MFCGLADVNVVKLKTWFIASRKFALSLHNSCQQQAALTLQLLCAQVAVCWRPGSARDYCRCTVFGKITCFDSEHAASHQLASLSTSVLSLKQISFVCVCVNRKVEHQAWQEA